MNLGYYEININYLCVKEMGMGVGGKHGTGLNGLMVASKKKLCFGSETCRHPSTRLRVSFNIRM